MGLQRQLADYVERHADAQLSECNADLVHSLLDKEAIEEAVQLYFARVGERWDQEWLEETIVPLPE